MSFNEIPDEVKALRARVRRFVDELVIPNEGVLMRDDEEARHVMKEVQVEARARKLWALNLPEEIGGGGLPFMPYVYVNEVIGRSHFGMEALGTRITQDSWMLYWYGTPTQKERWLMPMVRGDTTPCFSMTEPEVSGADPIGLRTRAVRNGDEWVINGHKWFSSGASQAAFATVMCVTDPEEPPHSRMSMIIVPTDTPGFEVIRPVPVFGDLVGDHCEVRYNDVRVAVTNLLGPQGAGFRIAQKRLGPGRIFHCMRWLGQMQRAFELMCQRALQRHAFGGPLADKQTVQNWIADSAAEIQAARLLTLHAADKIDQGDEARVEISLIKFFGAKVLHDVIDRAIQVHGALGVTEDTPLASMYRQARAGRIYDGPDEVHRMVVSRRLLRAYKENGAWDFAASPARMP
jgi:acyl-CoA dehydrogenase